MGWMLHEACMEYLRDIYKVLFLNTEEMRPLGQFRDTGLGSYWGVGNKELTVANIRS
jgi:hypothetical protein